MVKVEVDQSTFENHDNEFKEEFRKEFFKHGVTPREIAHYYGFPINEYKGEGESIALISYSGKIEEDKLKALVPSYRGKLEMIDTVKIPTHQDKSGDTLEIEMDFQILASICPKADITIYRSRIKAQYMITPIKCAVDSNKHKIISISYSNIENGYFKQLKSSGIKKEDIDKVFKKAHNNNIIICAASGDHLSSNIHDRKGGTVDYPGPDPYAFICFPASNPFVLAIGGTDLVDNQTDLVDNQCNEIVWNKKANNGEIFGGGGGISRFYDTQNWQYKAVRGIHEWKGSVKSDRKLRRVIPDVSALAVNWKIKVYDKDKIIIRKLSGTSASTPLWAAFFCLVNEERTRQGLPRLTNVAQKLYELNSDKYFNQNIKGHNGHRIGYPHFKSRKGQFDACTGLGSPKGKPLFQALTYPDFDQRRELEASLNSSSGEFLTFIPNMIGIGYIALLKDGSEKFYTARRPIRNNQINWSRRKDWKKLKQTYYFNINSNELNDSTPLGVRISMVFKREKEHLKEKEHLYVITQFNYDVGYYEHGGMHLVYDSSTENNDESSSKMILHSKTTVFLFKVLNNNIFELISKHNESHSNYILLTATTKNLGWFDEESEDTRISQLDSNGNMFDEESEDTRIFQLDSNGNIKEFPLLIKDKNWMLLKIGSFPLDIKNDPLNEFILFEYVDSHESNDYFIVVTCYAAYLIEISKKNIPSATHRYKIIIKSKVYLNHKRTLNAISWEYTHSIMASKDTLNILIRNTTKNIDSVVQYRRKDKKIHYWERPKDNKS